jgi:hypothetical protein
MIIKRIEKNWKSYLEEGMLKLGGSKLRETRVDISFCSWFLVALLKVRLEILDRTKLGWRVKRSTELLLSEQSCSPGY